MNIVLRDPALSLLLNDVRYRLSPGFISCVNFRKHERSHQSVCNSCRFCRVCTSSLEIASLICRILASGYRDLNVFLIADDDQDVYSTFMLDYLRSLYTLVIQTYSRYKSECKIYARDDGVGLLNPNAYNLTILPVHDWRRLLHEGTSNAVFTRDGNMRFLSIANCKYVFDDFYSELKAYNESEGVVGMLASCACSEGDHHILRHQMSSNSGMPNDLTFSSDAIVQEDICNLNGSSASPLNCVFPDSGTDAPKSNYQPTSSMEQSLSTSLSLSSNTKLCNPDKSDEGLSEISDIDCLALYEPCDEGCAVRDVLFFDNVICGGTFDCLHFGHKYLLLVAFLSCRKSLHIGITASDALLHRKRDFLLIQSYEKRLEVVENYLSMLKLLYGSKVVQASTLPPDFLNGDRLISYQNCDFFSCNSEPLPLPHCGEFSYQEFVLNKSGAVSPPEECPSGVSVTTFRLMDIYGPADVLDDSFALVISPESLPGAEQVNEYRRSKGLLGWPLLSGGFVLHREFDCALHSVDKLFEVESDYSGLHLWYRVESMTRNFKEHLWFAIQLHHNTEDRVLEFTWLCNNALCHLQLCCYNSHIDDAFVV